jgi:adenine specific DNA methylase Mod
MENRLSLSSQFLNKYGVICIAIDDEEFFGLRYIASHLFDKLIGIVSVRSNPAGRKTKGRFAPAIEYALFYGKNSDSIPVH